MRTEQNYIRTYTGKKFWPLDPRPEDVDIVDIAHALSNQCRFTGHTREFYSVAQHSLAVCNRCPKKNKLEGLLHDAEEAYLIDLARPVKHSPELAMFRTYGDLISKAIYERFGVDGSGKARIKIFDAEEYEIERLGLMPTGNNTYWLQGYSPRKAKRYFLETFYRLTCSPAEPNDTRSLPRDQARQ